jgi:hypothetical protein
MTASTESGEGTNHFFFLSCLRCSIVHRMILAVDCR